MLNSHKKNIKNEGNHGLKENTHTHTIGTEKKNKTIAMDLNESDKPFRKTHVL